MWIAIEKTARAGGASRADSHVGGTHVAGLKSCFGVVLNSFYAGRPAARPSRRDCLELRFLASAFGDARGRAGMFAPPWPPPRPATTQE